MNKDEILIKTAQEYFQSGKEEFSKKRYNSFVVLFFKSIIALADLHIFKKIGETPSSHNDRFKITKEQFSDIYNLIDKNFPFYQDSYNIMMTKELAEVMKEDAEKIAKQNEVVL